MDCQWTDDNGDDDGSAYYDIRDIGLSNFTVIVDAVPRAVVADQEIVTNHERLRGEVRKLTRQMLPNEWLAVPRVEDSMIR